MKKQRIIALFFLSFLAVASHANGVDPVSKSQEVDTNPGHLTIFEDLIYWHASQEPTSPWAYVKTLNAPPAPGAMYNEPNVYFNWSPGLKLGIKYDRPNLIDTKFYWTYFSTKTHEELSVGPNVIILPEFFNGFTTENLFNNAQLNWRIIMNMFDGEIGHTFKPLNTLSLRPFIGVKGGTINQTLNSSWQATYDSTNIYSATENLKNNFYGLGPSFGIDSVWNLYKNFNILSDFSTAFLWGNWNIIDVYHRPAALIGIIPETTISTNTKNSTLGAFMAGYFLGLEWTAPTKTLVKIKAGYEMQFWSNQLRLPFFQQVPLHGDLTLQGATCGISINL